jgi:hypothetical protein
VAMRVKGTQQERGSKDTPESLAFTREYVWLRCPTDGTAAEWRIDGSHHGKVGLAAKIR